MLNKVMRQADPLQQVFRELLMRLRSGVCTEEDWELLSTRFVNNVNEETIESFTDATCLFNTKVKVTNHNLCKLATLAHGENPQESCRIDAYHLPLTKKKTAQAITSDKMMGLDASIYLARGARIMITQNVWVEKGIANGACGTIRHIIFAKGSCPPTLPQAVIVEMDQGYNGPCIEDMPRCIALNPVMSYCESYSSGRLERTQLPIRLAFAVTIHKCQG